VIVLDATVLIAHFGSADRHHDSATHLLNELVGDILLVHPVNLAEVLVGGVRQGRGQQMAADLETLGVVVADQLEGEPLRLAELRVRSGLKLPDCCALDTAITRQSALATFDQALAAAARTEGVQVLA